MKRKFSPAQINYMKAKAAHDTIKELSEKIKTKILSENIFMSEAVEIPNDDGTTYTEQSKRIIEPISDFRMSSEDFTTYCKLCFEEYKKHGIAPKDHNTVVTHKYWEALKKAEKELIEWGYSVVKKLPEYRAVAKDLKGLKDTMEWNIKVREKFIDITMKVTA